MPRLIDMFPYIAKNVRRYHYTTRDRVRPILEQGLKVMPGEGLSRYGGQQMLSKSEYPAVYTSVWPDSYYRARKDDNEALLVIDIPNDAYRQMPRRVRNVELDRYDMENPEDRRFVMKYARDLLPVQQGGRADLFEESIPPEYIRGVIIPESSGKSYGHTRQNILDAIIDEMDENEVWDLSRDILLFSGRR